MSDRWLYRVFGQEFGPVSLDLVKTLVAAGTIAPDDEVRDATRSNWILACSASELSGSIQTPVAELVAERRAVRDEWYCRGAGGEIGPLKLSDLIQLAADGDLRPDEDVKAWADDQWKQLGSISRLVELLPFLDEDRIPAIDSTLPIGTAILRLTGSGRKSSNSARFTHSDEANIIPFPVVELTDANDTLADSFSAPPTSMECESASVSSCMEAILPIFGPMYCSDSWMQTELPDAFASEQPLKAKLEVVPVLAPAASSATFVSTDRTVVDPVEESSLFEKRPTVKRPTVAMAINPLRVRQTNTRRSFAKVMLSLRSLAADPASIGLVVVLAMGLFLLSLGSRQ